MIIHAHIRRGSAIDKLWRHHHRLGGSLCGTHFKLIGTWQAGRYEAKHVDPQHLHALVDHVATQVEMSGVDPVVASFPETSSETVPESEPNEPETDAETLTEVTDTPKRRGRPPKAVD